MQRNSGWSIRKGSDQLMMLDNGFRALFDVSADPGGMANLLDEPDEAAAETTADELETLAVELRGSND